MEQPKGSTSYTEDFHASNCPSAWLAIGKAGTTRDIYGRNFRAWSEKLNLFGWSLKTYLASSNLPRTTFARIWSVSVTPLGYGCMKLRLSARSTGECGCFLWRAPEAGDCANRKFARNSRGEPKLSAQVKLFRTPDAGCARGAQSKERFAESLKEGRLLTLNDQVAHLFPTPRATDGDKGTRSAEGSLKELARGHGVDLGASVRIFPTPTRDDAKNSNPPSQRTENGRHSDQLNVVAGGSLNPSWVEWLMGFPIGWTADIGG